MCHSWDISRYTTFESYNSPFCSSVTGGNEAGVDHVLIQPFLLYYVNHVVLMLSSIFKAKFALEKGGGLYQNKANLGLAFTQRLGH